MSDNKKNDQSTIIIDLDHSLAPRVWQGRHEKDDTGKDIVDTVFNSLREVVEKMLQVVNDEGSQIDDTKSLFERQALGEYNNIVSIIGNRGTGKSSILRSVPFAFNLDSSKDKKPFGINDLIKDKLASSTRVDELKFYPLPILDPNIFSNKDSLLEGIVAELFLEFQKEIKKNEHSGDEDHQRNLLEAFKAMRTSLQAARMETVQLLGENLTSSAYSDIESLEHLSAGVSLLKKVGMLVRQFLIWRFQDKSVISKKYMVVCIDDLDLFSGDVTLILQDLRVLMQVPGLLIVTGFRIEQLKEAIEEDYIRKFKKLLKSKRGRDVFETPDRMAFKFLQKMFPLGRRYLISFLDTSNLPVRILRNKYVEHDEENIEKLVNTLLYTRAGVKLGFDLYNRHPLIPTSMRELVQFIALLTQMTPTHEEAGNLISILESKMGVHKTLSKNIEELKALWIDQLCQNGLNVAFHDFVNEIKLTPTKARNKFVVRRLLVLLNRYRYKKNNIYLSDEELSSSIVLADKDFYSRSKKYLILGTNEGADKFKDMKLLHLVKIENYNSNVSLGDVIYVLFVIQDIFEHDREILTVVSLIRLLYSLEFSKNRYIENNEEAFYLTGVNIINPFLAKIIPRISRNVKSDVNSSVSRFGYPLEFSSATKVKISDDDQVIKTKSISFISSLLYGPFNNNYRTDKLSYGYHTNNTKYAYFSLLNSVVFDLSKEANTIVKNRFYPSEIDDLSSSDFKEKHGKFLLPIFALEIFEQELYKISKDRDLFRNPGKNVNIDAEVIKKFWNRLVGDFIKLKVLPEKEVLIKENFFKEVLGELNNNYYLSYIHYIDKIKPLQASNDDSYSVSETDDEENDYTPTENETPETPADNKGADGRNPTPTPETDPTTV